MDQILVKKKVIPVYTANHSPPFFFKLMYTCFSVHCSIATGEKKITYGEFLGYQVTLTYFGMAPNAANQEVSGLNPPFFYELTRWP